MKNLKKVNVFKTTFPDGSTHYGVSEQVFTIEGYLKKCISISLGHYRDDNQSKFHKEVLVNQDNLVAEIVGEFDNSEDAKTFRNKSIENDKKCFNQLSANVLAKLDYELKPLRLPIGFSKLLTNKDGEKIYYVDVLFAKKKQLLKDVNIKVKHPMFSNMVQLTRDTHKVERI